ncbi:uroporphyrinogen decarboxylase family protein [Romboutsia lituseburensis]|uniref:Uroporphyrinogen decarboxylase (URO-D) n=1 Tax=Romboutsia lituseburensis DSM 797 TaxID=1121325 RepID=A0A1G9LFB0_9FIRM|nr:uroporphyrinogen decarboxylase family protein [Romboutsia lituseburensis]CEH35283.1 Uroporphyrinogen decarboxylase (URO-D) [Romboutsia lituseburensis]SDL60463.1 Uroporphyrinogen decarboxylase (URO-D) [Romboutsia lituseburensis DSM 797]
MKNIFKCNQNDNENIPMEIIDNTHLKFPDLHTNSKDIAYVSQNLKLYKNDSICKVPFCTTVEAEAMGANIKLGDEKNCPRISNYAYKDINELLDIEDINLERGRIKEVLDSISILKNKGEIVVLNVCGPFTILSLLIDSKYIYKALRKDKSTVENILNKIENNIVKYVKKAIENKVDIISYSDPMSSIEIVGPKVYKEIVGNTTIRTLEKLDNSIESSVIHLCGKVSTSLQSYKNLEVEEISYNLDLRYGEAIYNLLETKNKNNIFIGHNCMKKTPYILEESIIYKIKIN